MADEFISREELEVLFDGLAVGSLRTRETFDADLDALRVMASAPDHLTLMEADNLHDLPLRRTEHVDGCSYCQRLVDAVYVNKVDLSTFERKIHEEVAALPSPRPPRRNWAMAPALLALGIAMGVGAYAGTMRLSAGRPDVHLASHVTPARSVPAEAAIIASSSGSVPSVAEVITSSSAPTPCVPRPAELRAHIQRPPAVVHTPAIAPRSSDLIDETVALGTLKERLARYSTQTDSQAALLAALVRSNSLTRLRTAPIRCSPALSRGDGFVSTLRFDSAITDPASVSLAVDKSSAQDTVTAMGWTSWTTGLETILDAVVPSTTTYTYTPAAQVPLSAYYDCADTRAVQLTPTQRWQLAQYYYSQARAVLAGDDSDSVMRQVSTK